MDVHPWLPSFTAASNRVAFLEAAAGGNSRFVEVTSEPFAPLHSFFNTQASPFNSALACDCGAKNVDGACMPARGALTSQPFYQPRLSSVPLQPQPYELIPAQRR